MSFFLTVQWQESSNSLKQEQKYSEPCNNYFHIITYDSHVSPSNRQQLVESHKVSSSNPCPPEDEPHKLSGDRLQDKLYMFGSTTGKTLKRRVSKPYVACSVQHFHIVAVIHIAACRERWRDCQVFGWLAREFLFPSHSLPETQTAVH